MDATRVIQDGSTVPLTRNVSSMSPTSMNGLFTRFAKWTAAKTGGASTFAVAVLVILVWAVTGPMFHYNDTWQLAINTGTTIVTFLMVFLIQNTQNRDTAALQLKLDELICAQQGARNVLLDLEELDQESLEEIRERYQHLARRERETHDAPNDNTERESHPATEQSDKEKC